MMRSKRIVEAGKTLLIILLLISAVFLGRETGLFSDFFRAVPVFSFITDSLGIERDKPDGQTPPNTLPAEAAQPMTIAITGENGGRFCTAYDEQTLQKVYGNTGYLLGEALGASDAPEETTQPEWERFLTLPGIYFDYLYPVPVSALAGWFGTSVSYISEASARRFVIALDGGEVFLCYRDEQTGGYLKSLTPLKGEAMTEKLNTYLSNEAQFAFELGKLYKDVESYTLIIPGTAIQKAAETGAAAVQDNPEELLDVFGINIYTASTYTEPDGTEVYVDGDQTLRIGKSGYVIYKKAGKPEGISDTDAAAAIESARGLASSLGQYCGDAKVSYTGVRGRDSEFTVTFGYTLNGVPVHLNSDGWAARITVSEGTVTEARMHYREYKLLSEDISLLREPQAAAAAAAIKPGGELLLCYPDPGGELILPEWTVR